MTSSLPDFSANPASAPANDAASLAALFTDAGADPGSGSAPEFAALMGASSAPATAAAPVGAPGQPAGALGCPNAPTRMSGQRQSLPAMLEAAVPEEPIASTFGAKVALTVSAIELASSVAPLGEPAAPMGPREITRDMLEEAAAFVTSLFQAALPGIQLPELLGLANKQAPAATGSAGNSAGVPSLLSQAMMGAGNEPAEAQAMAAAQPFTLGADGAIELKLDLAQLKPFAFQLDAAADQSLAVSAELQRPGEVTVRLEAAAIAPAALRTGGPVERAIFAAKYPGLKITAATPSQPGERNFVFTGDKQVKLAAPVAGISVAKTETTMPVVPTEEPRFTRNPELFSVLPQRAEFQVVVPTAERITDPAAVPAEQNFAERAVATVTSLAETQFSASMQKAGSVQLRLRFGSEDLSVRVELRDGAVHTNFHTDSPELRSALAREWQSVAAQSPEQMRRYLEPVFSPAPSSADTPSSSGRQPPHQQNQQSQQEQPSRSQRESWADSTLSFSRRSQLSDSFVPEPAALRGPALLPTSLRLSVLA